MIGKAGLEDAHLDLLDGPRHDAMRGAERERGVDRSLHVTAAGVGLHAGRAERVPVAGRTGAKSGVGIRASEYAVRKPNRPSRIVAGARSPPRRGRSVEPPRRPPSRGGRRFVQAPLARNSIEPDALAAGDPERCRERIHVEPEHGAGCGRRPEGTARSRRIENPRDDSAPPVRAPARASPRPRSPRPPRGARAGLRLGELGRGEGRREHAGAEVDRALLVGVVHLERVGSCAVGERRLGRRQTVRGSEHGRGARERERTGARDAGRRSTRRSTRRARRRGSRGRGRVPAR